MWCYGGFMLISWQKGHYTMFWCLVMIVNVNKSYMVGGILMKFEGNDCTHSIGLGDKIGWRLIGDVAKF